MTTPEEDKTHVVIVGVEPNDDYARNADGWLEDVFGPFTPDAAETFAQDVENAWVKERKRRRKNAFPYGEPYTKIRAIRNAGVNDAALNWVKEG